jgi:hypothetical protein
MPLPRDWMKRLSAEAHRRTRKVARRRAARAASRRWWRDRLHHQMTLRRWWECGDRARNRWIKAPAEFSLEEEEQRTAVVTFLRAVREAALSSDPRGVRIDFARTERMVAPGTLLFVAELDRINALRPGRVMCTSPRNNLVAQVLQHVEIFKKLNFSRPRAVTAENVVHWEVYSGSDADGSAAGRVLERHSQLFDSTLEARLYGGLTEAMTNTKQHAYEESGGDSYSRGDGFPDALKNWWMFTQHQREEGRLTVAICDLGMGIPRSLPKDVGVADALKAWLFGHSIQDDDGARIKAAFTVGTSRTGLANRGKGLMEIRSVLDGLHGRIHIHSNRGYYIYDGDKRAEVRCTTFPLKSSILGTLVLWSVPVKHGEKPS